MSELVLVTGGSGYLGAHVVKAALDAGYRVRTTVRSQAKAAAVRAAVGAGADSPLEFAVADLTSDQGWDEAVAGATYVQHVASPFPASQPRDEQQLIVPAREGTLRVLRAAVAAGLKRVVITSSFAAIGQGHGSSHPGPYTEADWTDVDGPNVPAYPKSKTLAERAAWDFVAEHPELELAVVNPVGIFGPPLGAPDGTSVLVIRTAQRSPIVPNLHLGVVDVRDVADLQLKAMTSPEAAGKRFLAVAGWTDMQQIAHLLGRRPVLLANWVPRMAAPVSGMARLLVEQARTVDGSADQAKTLLGWQPRPIADSIREMGVAAGGSRDHVAAARHLRTQSGDVHPRH